jgi:MoxR-like ATPase
MSDESLDARLARAQEAMARLREAIGRVIVGQREVVDQVLWGLVAGGHVLLEGAPGLGKTLLVRALASSLSLGFSRVQFTPDLMPSDVTGTNVLVMNQSGASTGRFELHRGPIFAEVVLADEINRATPKTQSALLEAMQEHAVTIAGTRHALPEPFFVLATENPIEMEGTYPLPEAQLDRFLVKILVPAPSEAELVDIIFRTTGEEPGLPEPVLGPGEILELRSLCRAIVVAEPVARYAARLVRASVPGAPDAPEIVGRALRYGAGVRAAQGLVLVGKAIALLEGRVQVGFRDIEIAAPPVLRHRLIRSFEGEADGITSEQVTSELLRAVGTRPPEVEAVVQGG